MPSLLPVAVLVLIYMTVIFVAALVRKDNSIVDIFWGPGFVLIAAFTFWQSGNSSVIKIFMNLLILIWGLRLGIHIFLRNRGKGEDFRYRAWRESWKYFTIRSFFQVFLLQGFFMFIISLPVQWINAAPVLSDGVPFWIALATSLTGLVFEIVGDTQLAIFKRKPGNKGKLMTTGLWSVTRHPNYFGEALFWWGLFLFSVKLENGWMMIVSPLVITLLLRFISGVPMLERKYEGRADWEEYQKRTAPFVPFVHFL